MSDDPDDEGHRQPIRDAATIVLVRDDGPGPPRVLMGQRGAKAAFMPSKYVFPGGAVDPGDQSILLTPALPEGEVARLTLRPVTAAPPAPQAMAAAAIRELWEEAGLMLAKPGLWEPSPPKDWADFARAGLRPNGAALRFIFRAVTPPGRTRRFDARFFLARAVDLVGDPDDFTHATDELGHLHWIALSEARGLDLPFITEVVLAEAEAVLHGATVASVPFFDNSGPVATFRRLA